MANKGQAYGDLAERQAKLAAKYDPALEKDLTGWIEKETGTKMEGTFHSWLKSGVVLCKLMNKLSPDSCKNIHTGEMSFKQVMMICFCVVFVLCLCCVCVCVCVCVIVVVIWFLVTAGDRWESGWQTSTSLFLSVFLFLFLSSLSLSFSLFLFLSFFLLLLFSFSSLLFPSLPITHSLTHSLTHF